MIQGPSQYECDNMEQGDVVYVRKVSTIYKIMRFLFHKDLAKIKVRSSWVEPIYYNEYYQEDCTLLYGYEIACIKKYEKEIPYMFSKQIGTRVLRTDYFPVVQISLYNLQISIDDNHTYTIPISYIQRAIEDNQRKLKLYDDNRKIKDAIKYQKYKGNYFKQYVINNNITEWVPLYCSICGKPVQFTFNKDDICIVNNCECGSLKFPLTKISYDEFALWYANQSIVPSVLKRYNSFWFNRGD